MKKYLIAVLVLMLIPTFCLAADLSSYSFSELVELQKAVTFEIMSRPEWQEVEVPAGEWIVGEDIPAGTYSISKTSYCTVEIFRKPEDKYPSKTYLLLSKEDSVDKTKLSEGMLVRVNYPVVFAPPKGLNF